MRHDSPLASVALPQYWHEEISHVIKGRGITTFEQYAQLARVGRRIPLPAAHREAVWRLYQEYERLRTAAGVPDWADVLRQARDLVHAGTEAGRYDAVIVDEVQDLSCVGLQLLHGLLGRDADGLLLVGDGQQSIYPGGFTLAEAGISVVGRSTVLDRNYRNTDDVLRYALSVVGDDPFDDLEADLVAGLREVAVDAPRWPGGAGTALPSGAPGPGAGHPHPDLARCRCPARRPGRAGAQQRAGREVAVVARRPRDWTRPCCATTTGPGPRR